ncbi:uncharacterized protein LOC110628335 isoform X5 [Manihot esculenta]|nr:uncharacterized protein LOC110628335 isoform X5 [Manihot esculenta]
MLASMVGNADESPELLSFAAAKSSPSLADGSFRQVDDVFLQTQTRIWLGEVLQTRLSDQLSIADLLADGELLYEVSRKIWKMMLAKHVELDCIRTYEFEPFASRSIGRYMPYSNVDSFLKKNSSAVSRSYHLHFEEFDDLESKIVHQSDSSDTITYYPSSQISSDSIRNCTEVSSAIKNELSDRCSVGLDVQNQLGDEDLYCQQAGSLFSHHFDHQQGDMPSPTFVDSNIQLGGKVFYAERDAKYRYRSTVLDQIYNDTIMEDGASVVGDSGECTTPESTISEDQSAMSAIVGLETDTGESILLDGKDYIFYACDACTSCSKAIRNLQNEFKSPYLDSDDVESSSAACVSSVSVALQNFDFDNHSDTEDVLKNECSPESANSQLCGLSKKQTEESLSDLKDVDVGFSSIKHNGYLDHAISYDNSICSSQINSNVAYDEGTGLFVDQSCFPLWDQKGKWRIAVVPIGNGDHGASSLSISPVGSHEENLHFIQTEVTEDALRFKKIESIVADNEKAVHRITIVQSEPDTCKRPDECLLVACSDNLTHRKHEDSNGSCNVAVQSGNVNKEGEKETLQMSAVENPKMAAQKNQKQPLLKSVVKGTAILGALFLFNHLRKNCTDKSGRLAEQSNQIRSGGDSSSAMRKRGKIADGVYPAERLKLVH